ncbi:MAG: TonB-dependent receptor, partial [Bacteroidetes bacterium]|nr:TonB-dependent receptor [Bacteroidota bacterium]
MKSFRYIALWLILLVSRLALCQQYATLNGIISDETGKPVELVNISVPGISGTTTNTKGFYEFKVPAAKRITVIFSHLEYQTDTLYITLKSGEHRRLNRQLKQRTNILRPVEITVDMKEEIGMERIPAQTVKIMPTISEGIESLLTGQIGVSKRGGELSSQYSVRGGNFDENLVYVNDIEVYRPFLIRSGQQEGLSFTNPDLVSSVLFSAGGFEARYGDKMSSVLDIRYRKPSEFTASASASLLGGSAHIEGCTKNYRLTHISGFRYKSSQYMLKSLDTKGEYNPSFID